MGHSDGMEGGEWGVEFAALIPARAGSKRVPNKNMRVVGGWPLLRYPIEIAQQCEIFREVVVSSDSQEYLDYAESLGATPRMRKMGSADDSTDHDVIFEYLADNLANLSMENLAIVYLRPTTPFRTVTLVRSAMADFEAIINDMTPPTGLRSVEEMSESAYKCFEKVGDLLVPINYPVWEDGVLVNEYEDVTDWPNHKVRKTYRPNGYIDICMAETVIAGKLWGDRIYGFETPRTIEIDTEYDLAYADWYSSTRNVREEVVFR